MGHIRHQHDVTGGVFLNLLMGHRGFALMALGLFGWLCFLMIQDWMSGRDLPASQYAITLIDGSAHFTGVEDAELIQSIRIENRSNIALTRVRLNRKIYTCPPGHKALHECNKIEEQPIYADVLLAPGESAVKDLSKRLHPVGTKGDETFIIRTKIEGVEGDADKDA